MYPFERSHVQCLTELIRDNHTFIFVSKSERGGGRRIVKQMVIRSEHFKMLRFVTIHLPRNDKPAQFSSNYLENRADTKEIRILRLRIEAQTMRIDYNIDRNQI